MLPIIHIDDLAKDLHVNRRWIIDHWIKKPEEEGRSDKVAPHFSDGNHIFFNTKELDEWAKRRSYGFDSTSIETEPSD